MAITPLFALLMALSGQAAVPEPSCPPQPMPSALDTLAPRDSVRTIAFSATPSLEYPRRAWVVRLSQKLYHGPATVEILRLRGQEDCNRYDIEASWSASIPEGQFEAFLHSVSPLGTPPTDQFSDQDPMRNLDAVGIDGTSIMLALTDFSWETKRRLHNGSKGGAAVSSLFYSLLSEHLPESELPTEDWYSPRSGLLQQ